MGISVLKFWQPPIESFCSCSPGFLLAVAKAGSHCCMVSSKAPEDDVEEIKETTVSLSTEGFFLVEKLFSLDSRLALAGVHLKGYFTQN